MDLSTGHVQNYAASLDAATEGQKRPLSTPPHDSSDWKRQRVEPGVTATVSPEAAPIDPRLMQPSAHVGQPASMAGFPASNVAPASGAGLAVDPTGSQASPGVAPADLPVVEAMVRREGTDKFKRFPFDPTMNAEQRAEKIQDERKKICPKSAIDRVLAGLGASDSFQYDDNMAPSLCLLAEHMLEQTMEFGALMASRRKSKWLEAKDMELYLDRNWQIPLPAFGHRSISAVPKYNAESTDARHRAAVRAALAALQPVEAQVKKADDRGAPVVRKEEGTEERNE